MDFGIMFFSSADRQSDRGKYQLLIEAAEEWSVVDNLSDRRVAISFLIEKRFLRA